MQPIEVPKMRRRWFTLKTLFQHLVLRGDHVIVVILRKAGMHAVARFAGFSVTQVVGKNNEVPSDVEELSGTEQLARKLRLQKLTATAACAVKDHDGVGNTSTAVACRLAECCIVHPQLRQRLARAKMEVVRDVVALPRSSKTCNCVRLLGCESGDKKESSQQYSCSIERKLLHGSVLLYL
jgi:hypothetical protein